MRCFLFGPAAIVIAVALVAQTPTSSDNKLAADPSATLCVVAGRVVAAADGNPLKSARVALIPDHSRGHERVYAATSDDDGHFTIKDIPPGRYRFFASRPGFVEQHYKAGTNDTGPLFSLHSGQKVDDVLFRLILASVITGRVTNQDGEGMQHVSVVALRRPTEDEAEDIALRVHKTQMEPVRSAESDDRGQYRIYGLKPGEYFVRAEDNSEPSSGPAPIDESFWLKQSLGSDYAPVYFPGAAQASQAQVIPIKAGEEIQADIVMRHVKTVDVAGHVIGLNGPAANTMVNLWPVDNNSSDFNRQDTTDEKGAFHLRNIPEGSYNIFVYERQEGTRTYRSQARQRIDVTDENIDSLTVTLTMGAKIQGRLKIDGAASVTPDRLHLSLMPTEEDGQPGACDVNKDGSFEFASVRDGSYFFTAWGLDRDAYIKSARRGPDDLLEKGLQVEGGASGKIEVVVASDSAQLEGSVTDDDGPVIGAQIRLNPDPITPFNHLRIQRTTTDQLGHFSIGNIPPGKYRVSARPMVVSESGSYKSEPQSVTLTGNDRQAIEMKLEKQQE